MTKSGRSSVTRLDPARELERRVDVVAGDGAVVVEDVGAVSRDVALDHGDRPARPRPWARRARVPGASTTAPTAATAATVRSRAPRSSDGPREQDAEERQHEREHRHARRTAGPAPTACRRWRSVSRPQGIPPSGQLERTVSTATQRGGHPGRSGAQPQQPRHRGAERREEGGLERGQRQPGVVADTRIQNSSTNWNADPEGEAGQPGAAARAGRGAPARSRRRRAAGGPRARSARTPAPARRRRAARDRSAGARGQRYRWAGHRPGTCRSGRVPSSFGPTRDRPAADHEKLSREPGTLPLSPSRPWTGLRGSRGARVGWTPVTRPLGRRSADRELRGRTTPNLRSPRPVLSTAARPAGTRKRAGQRGRRAGKNRKENLTAGGVSRPTRRTRRAVPSVSPGRRRCRSRSWPAAAGRARRAAPGRSAVAAPRATTWTANASPRERVPTRVISQLISSTSPARTGARNCTSAYDAKSPSSPSVTMHISVATSPNSARL